MTDNPTSIFDGDGRYGSRTRVNREYVEITMPAAATVSETIQLNGKIARIILDPSRITSNGSVLAGSGSLTLAMDIEDSGGSEYTYCNAVSSLDFRTSSNTPFHFQTAEGANTDTAGVHFTVTNPAGVAAAWSGLVCGALKITLAVSAGAFTGGTARVVIIYE